MLLVVTVATFLGALAVPLLLFLLFARKEQIRKALREHRRETRTPLEVALELSSLDEPFVYETAPTENVSCHGARVVTTKRWRPNERVLVRLPRSNERSHAQIAYCALLTPDRFAAGLKFFSAVDTNDLEPAIHPYGK